MPLDEIIRSTFGTSTRPHATPSIDTVARPASPIFSKATDTVAAPTGIGRSDTAL